MFFDPEDMEQFADQGSAGEDLDGNIFCLLASFGLVARFDVVNSVTDLSLNLVVVNINRVQYSRVQNSWHGYEAVVLNTTAGHVYS